MPGFKLPPRAVTLVFEDGRLEGLELKVRLDVPLGFYFELQRWRDDQSSADDLTLTRAVLRQFAEHALIDWNLLDEDDQPVPATPDAVEAHLDPLSFGLMLGKYLGAVGGVRAPLRRRSSGGRTSKARQGSRSRQN